MFYVRYSGVFDDFQCFWARFWSKSLILVFPGHENHEKTSTSRSSSSVMPTTLRMLSYAIAIYNSRSRDLEG